MIKITDEDKNLSYEDKYPDVEITLSDVYELIQNLKKRRQYAQKVKEQVTLIPNWTAAEYYNRITKERIPNIMNSIGITSPYVIDEGRNWEILLFFCFYYSRDGENFIQLCNDRSYFLKSKFENISLDKGIMLMGNTGRGKSLLFKAFRDNPFRSYQFIDAKYIRDEYYSNENINKAGIEIIRHYSSDFESSHRSIFNQRIFDLCIDDFGVEDPVSLWGNKTEVLLEVLMNRLNSGRITHISTNLTLEEITNRYGSRLVSRLHEQMNILHFPAGTPDYRTISKLSKH